MSKFTSAMNAAKDRSHVVAELVAPQIQATAATPAPPAPLPVRRGRPAGKHQEFWEAAERELKAQRKSGLNGSSPNPEPVEPPDDI